MNSQRLFRRFSIATLLAATLSTVGAVSTKAWDNTNNAVNYTTAKSWGAGITTDAAGNSYQVVPFEGTWTTGNISVTAPTTDRWAVAKYDSAGNPVWVSLPSDASLPIAAIAVDSSGNVYLSGDYHVTQHVGSTTFAAPASDWTDAWVGKMDSSGNMLWARSMNGTSYQGSAGVGVDSSGNVYVSGGFQGTTTFGEAGSKTSAGSNDLFLAKLNSAGVFQWATTAGSTGDDNLGWMQNLAVDSAGNSYVSGQIQGTVTVAGSTLVSSGSLDNFVAKVDTSGTWQWAARGGSTGYDNTYGIALDSSNNVYLTGQVAGAATFGSHSATNAGGRDAFVAKLNSTGTWQWVRTFGGSGTDDSVSITVDQSGNSIVGGYFDSNDFQVGGTSVPFGGVNDAFVVKYNSSGAFQWVRSIYGAKDDEIYGIGSDSSGNTYLSGYLSGPSTITFGTGTSINYGQSCSSDCYGVVLWKLSPSGGVPSASTPTSTTTTTTTTVAGNTNVTTTTVVATASGGTSSGSSINSKKTTSRNAVTTNTLAATSNSVEQQAQESIAVAATPDAPQAVEVQTGAFTAEIAGKKVSTTVRRESNQVILSVGEIEMTVAGETSAGARIPLNADGNLAVTNEDKINISIVGVKPDTEINSWIFSDPTLLGTMSVSADGKAESTFDVPASIASGAHTLTFEATTATGEVAALRYGVAIGGDSGGSSAIPAVLITIILLAVLSAIFLPAVIKRRKNAVQA